MVGLLVIETVGRGAAFGLAWKILRIDCIGLLAVASAGVLEVADEFGLLGIDTQDGLVVAHETGFDPLNEPILAITLRMDLADQALDVGLERIAQGLEYPPDGGRTPATETVG